MNKRIKLCTKKEAVAYIMSVYDIDVGGEMEPIFADVIKRLVELEKMTKTLKES